MIVFICLLAHLSEFDGLLPIAITHAYTYDIYVYSTLRNTVYANFVREVAMYVRTV